MAPPCRLGLLLLMAAVCVQADTEACERRTGLGRGNPGAAARGMGLIVKEARHGDMGSRGAAAASTRRPFPPLPPPCRPRRQRRHRHGGRSRLLPAARVRPRPLAAHQGVAGVRCGRALPGISNGGNRYLTVRLHMGCLICTCALGCSARPTGRNAAALSGPILCA